MKHVHILGLRVDDVTLGEAVKHCLRLLESSDPAPSPEPSGSEQADAGLKKGYVVTPNPEICSFGWNKKWFRRIVMNATLSIPDGFGLKIGAIFSSQWLKNRVSGIDLTWELLEQAEQKKYSVLFLGGSEFVGELALNVLTKKYPLLSVSHITGGQFSEAGESDNSHLNDEINALSPDIIFVCLGAPKQEQFMKNNIDSLDTKLMLGVGGSLDYIAGKVSRAPKLMRTLGLEWLYRVIREPLRLKRIITAVLVFPARCLYWNVVSRVRYRKNVAIMILDEQDNILLGLSQYGYWQIPQGGIKKGESLEDATKREMLDEVGDNTMEVIEIIKNCYKYKWSKESRKGFEHIGQKQSLVIVRFTGDVKNLTPSPYEFKELQWVSKDDILEMVGDFKRDIIRIGLEKSTYFNT